LLVPDDDARARLQVVVSGPLLRHPSQGRRIRGVEAGAGHRRL